MRGLQHRTGAEPGQGGPLPIFCVRNSSSQTTYGHAHRQPPPQRKVGVAQAKANLTWRLRAVTIMQFQNSTCTLSNSWLVLMSDRMSSMSAPPDKCFCQGHSELQVNARPHANLQLQ